MIHSFDVLFVIWLLKMPTFKDFNSIDLVVGTVLEVYIFERAKKPAYRVRVDFGKKYGVLETSAQITKHYKIEDLIGKRVVGCVNIGERNIAGFTSQFLLCGFCDKDNEIVLPIISEDFDVENGSKLC